MLDTSLGHITRSLIITQVPWCTVVCSSGTCRFWVWGCRWSCMYDRNKFLQYMCSTPPAKLSRPIPPTRKHLNTTTASKTQSKNYHSVSLAISDILLKFISKHIWYCVVTITIIVSNTGLGKTATVTAPNILYTFSYLRMCILMPLRGSPEFQCMKWLGSY